MTSQDVKAVLVFGAFGTIMTAVGWAAWTGRYRGWVKLGRGYRVLTMLPSGVGFLLLAVSFLLPRPLDGLTFGLGVLFVLLGFLYFLATLFVKDRWYPRWYHQLPPDERTW
ncbi:MAG: hypothetical protein ABR592_05995 [Nitriliruptorales bacterium]